MNQRPPSILGKDIPIEARRCIFICGFDPKVKGDEEAAIEKAKAYVRRQALTPEFVRIVKDNEDILVMTRKDTFLKE